MAAGSSIQVAADLNQLETIRRFVEQHAAALRIDPAMTYDLVLAVDEMATNIIVHGYRQQPGTIDIALRHIGDGIEIRLRDHAPPFDPTRVAAPDLSLPLSKRPLGGMGIHIAGQLTDAMSYRRTQEGDNELILRKDRIVPSIAQEKSHEPDC